MSKPYEACHKELFTLPMLATSVMFASIFKHDIQCGGDFRLRFLLSNCNQIIRNSETSLLLQQSVNAGIMN